MLPRRPALLILPLLLLLPLSHADAPAYIGVGRGTTAGAYLLPELCARDVSIVGVVWQHPTDGWIPEVHFFSDNKFVPDAAVPCDYDHNIPIRFLGSEVPIVTGSPEEGFFVDLRDDCSDSFVVWGPLGPATSVQGQWINTCGSFRFWMNATLSFDLTR